MGQLLPFVYDELREMAGHAFERSGNRTLQATALVHEAWMKVADHLDGYANRKSFFVVAAKAMRQVLLDHARKRKRIKRGGGRRMITFDENLHGGRSDGLELVHLSDCLERLGALHERHAKIVELRILGSLTITETAKVLGVSTSTVESDWAMARAWLRNELAAGD